MNPSSAKLSGLIAAPHTPFHSDGSLNLAAVKKQAEHFAANRIERVFVGGTTGECHSLSLQERKALAEQWARQARATRVELIVHVGSNCAGDSRELAAQAAQLGAIGIAAVAPFFFKPPDVPSLVDWCAQIASAAPGLPFYYYDIPGYSGVNLSMPEFIKQASEQIPNFGGMKFTNPDLLGYQECLRLWGDRLDLLFGLDELLLAALVFGCRGAVGATYNFAAPLYWRLIAAFQRGDLETARQEQFRSVQLIKTLNRYGFFGATKAVMKMIGVDVGPTRLPNANPSTERTALLRRDLEELGFFAWIKS